MEKKLGEYKNYIFDLDGTLYFQKPVRRAMALRLMCYYAFRFWKIGELIELKNYRKKRETPEGIVDITSPAIERWLIDRPLKSVAKHADRVLCEFIQKQKVAGKTIIIYSDYPVEKKLAALGLEGYVDCTFSAGDDGVRCLKPDPRGINYIIAQTRIEPSETILVGDRMEKDGLCAKSVGMDYLILARGKRGRRYDEIL